MKYFSAIIVLASTLTYANVSHSAVLTLDYTNVLSNQLADTMSNFAPQGLGFDTSTNELLFAQQSSRTIYRTDLQGQILGSLAINLHHTTSVAGDANNYYVSDYTGNASYQDLHTIDKTTGYRTDLSSEVAAYGGYPIDVRNGVLYRAENSRAYNWSGLSQIRISNLSSADTITQTLTLSTANGIGDIAVDSARNQLWTIDYTANALIRQFDITTGLELANFDFGLDGLSSGITYANDTLYFYDWKNGSGSTLSAYSIETANVEASAPAMLGLVCLGLLGMGYRRHKTLNS
ncbi:hypothetical protein [Glaciecola sp. 1036]|uniref:hypothetical protein n=1 Tax=Alteromonadaceae TaxID=72275 RepID=UPI003D073C91